MFTKYSQQHEMKKSKKFFSNGKKGGFKPTTKKKRKEHKSNEIVNKKALFNRYKNVQKVEEEIEKKKQMEKKLQQLQVQYSESEEEEDTFGQLVSCFRGSSNKTPVVESDEETDSSKHSDEDDADMVSENEVVDIGDISDKDTDVENSGDTSDKEFEVSVSWIITCLIKVLNTLVISNLPENNF